MVKTTQLIGVVLTMGGSALLCGCVAGPTALQASRVRYNQAIQATTAEQLLLNLVRLQYREPPLFLEVGAVSAQFAFKTAVDADLAVYEGPLPSSSNRMDLGAGVSFEEKPTVTFTPLQGGDFVKQVLTPLDFDVLLLLSRSGWSIDRVLRLTVQTMNGLDNASGASGPTPRQAPRYEEFARLAQLLRRLQTQGLLELGYESRVEELSPPLPVAQVRLSDLVEAANHGYRARLAQDGASFVLTNKPRVLLWRVPPEAADSAEVREIIELLGLAPGHAEYEIRMLLTGRSSGSVPRGQRTAITIATRSLMGTLFYLAQAIEIPEVHRERGVVTTTVTSDGEPFDWHQVTGDLLSVHARSKPPTGAAVRVRHRGWWYYINDTDLTSKSTFSLMSQLFALQAGEVRATAPVLTLPIGG